VTNINKICEAIPDVVEEKEVSQRILKLRSFIDILQKCQEIYIQEELLKYPLVTDYTIPEKVSNKFKSFHELNTYIESIKQKSTCKKVKRLTPVLHQKISQALIETSHEVGCLHKVVAPEKLAKAMSSIVSIDDEDGERDYVPEIDDEISLRNLQWHKYHMLSNERIEDTGENVDPMNSFYDRINWNRFTPNTHIPGHDIDGIIPICHWKIRGLLRPRMIQKNGEFIPMIRILWDRKGPKIVDKDWKMSEVRKILNFPRIVESGRFVIETITNTIEKFITYGVYKPVNSDSIMSSQFYKSNKIGRKYKKIIKKRSKDRTIPEMTILEDYLNGISSKEVIFYSSSGFDDLKGSVQLVYNMDHAYNKLYAKCGIVTTIIMKEFLKRLHFGAVNVIRKQLEIGTQLQAWTLISNGKGKYFVVFCNLS